MKDWLDTVASINTGVQPASIDVVYLQPFGKSIPYLRYFLRFRDVCLFVCVAVLQPCQQLRSCRAGQLPINTVPWQAMLNFNIHTSYFSHAVNYSHECVTFWYVWNIRTTNSEILTDTSTNFRRVKNSHVFVTSVKHSFDLFTCVTNTCEFFTRVTDSFECKSQTNLSQVWKFRTYLSHLWRISANFCQMWQIRANPLLLWRTRTNFSDLYYGHMSWVINS